MQHCSGVVAIFTVVAMHDSMKVAILGMFLPVMTGICIAEEVSREQIKGIDEQVQDIKKDVLGISSELVQLEEKLLYPSSTQVSLFVAIAKDDKFSLDAVDISMDGQETTHHIYTFKELEALQQGGVQRIYTGNVRTGEHTLEVTLIGKTAGNDDYRQSASYRFSKDEGPRLVEITVAGPAAGSNNINFKDW